MISANSRYKNSRLTTEEINSKSIVYILPTQPVVTIFQYSYYIVEFADRIDNIAYKFLGNPALWYVIAKVNPQIMDFLNLTPGTVIRIPNTSVIS